jgi:splicing factor 3A subunit 3
MLSSVIEDTKGRVEKRQAQTYEELLAEQQEAEEDAAPEDIDSEDEYVYNPLKLPLGWDGKPIPYWLYKLHGLNLEFKCEICGNASYWGRRAFERHFTEARHLAGMRALGIPNTKQFFEITTISDAMALWRTLQDRQGGGFKKDDDEEYEDAEGNVYSAKTYADLQRQGLL